MALTPEQIKSLKEQLKSQIKHLPEEKRIEAEQQIESLSPQSLELMLKQQKGKAQREQSIFRSIVSGEIPSAKIDENKYALAVLEINPVSKAHVIIIPKQQAKNPENIPSQAFALAKKLSKKIISKLKAKSCEIQTEKKLGESIINVIPIYDKELSVGSPRYKAKKEELEEIASKLRAKSKPKIEKIRIEKKLSSESQILKLPRKIP
jgi:histidine triad (HIT) family protein